MRNKLQVKLTLFMFISLACFFYNIDRNRVAQQTNSLHANPMPLVMDEGQQPDKHCQLRSEGSDSICPVVEISCSARNTRLDIKTCALSCL